MKCVMQVAENEVARFTQEDLDPSLGPTDVASQGYSDIKCALVCHDESVAQSLFGPHQYEDGQRSHKTDHVWEFGWLKTWPLDFRYTSDYSRSVVSIFLNVERQLGTMH